MDNLISMAGMDTTLCRNGISKCIATNSPYSSTGNTFNEQSFEATNEIIFSAVQEVENR
jgi:hypothetical protein